MDASTETIFLFDVSPGRRLASEYLRNYYTFHSKGLAIVSLILAQPARSDRFCLAKNKPTLTERKYNYFRT
ncbi:hypothetical protein PUN28_002879 [Cardiocondyla obscurior]|uniref:Uncharacterized protein n=1 Tax=Cardiocondyla obscurior TaxID=286306 RepID=A0AAW2GWG1_9HYME